MRSANLLFALLVILIPLSQGEPLVASTIFSALCIIENLNSNIVNFTHGLSSAADYFAVIKRIEKVVLLGEKEEQPFQQN